MTHEHKADIGNFCRTNTSNMVKLTLVLSTQYVRGPVLKRYIDK